MDGPSTFGVAGQRPDFYRVAECPDGQEIGLTNICAVSLLG
jgi:hypothetical protein